MNHLRSYFFCGIGGSGMLPLALILRARGARVAGSDRSLDQGRLGAKFEFLRAQGIGLHPQDGSGLTNPDQILVTSAAVEATIPDVQAARRLGMRAVTRAELLAELFNSAQTSIGIAGTSGKSTVTGMVGWILAEAGRKPTVMNGAVMKNFVSAETPFASAVVGDDGLFVSEVDESDGSIALYDPRIAVLNNVALDHKSMDELRRLFAEFIAKAETSVLNLDNEETVILGERIAAEKRITYSLTDHSADLIAARIEPGPAGISFDVTERKTGERVHVALSVPGRHNVSNALAAIGAARAVGVPVAQAAAALARFSGIKRRLELVGTAKGITVIDDFAHNPDKIAATLATLHDFPGRLLILFQPHGFGPLKLMRHALIDCFARNMNAGDILLMPQPVYYGGTVDRSVTSADIVEGVRAKGREALAFETRAQCGEKLLELARPGDSILIMGARDDTLGEFAADLLSALAK